MAIWSVTKRIEVAGSHKLYLPYASPCRALHGHNWIISVTVSAPELNNAGMVIDFSKVAKVVNALDHQHLNDMLGGDLNPTAENIAKWICDGVQDLIDHQDAVDYIPAQVTKVVVRESENNEAVYEPLEEME